MTIIGNISNTASASPPVTQLTPNPPPAGNGSGGFSFGDILDALNPLQHIPVISNIYRAATGSQISGASQVAGDTLYGAPFGGVSALISFASSLADVAVKQTTGEDITQHVIGTVNAAAGAVIPSAVTVNAVPVTPLTPSANATPPQLPPPGTGNTSKLSAQLVNATQSIYHTNPHQHYQHTNAQYQRAQVFDALNKQLVKMAV